ncbi:MAG: MFS transporter [Lachnospiraceae bacterium]|nr:MFS transporter [Lachnospiraceae bacterium]MDD7701759.1 MFS transporter [Lachnospiraceae bacterium]
MTTLLLIIIYFAFISLGLPDSLLGSIWPIAHRELGVPLAWSGPIFMIISLGTVVSSLFSDRLTRRLGAGLVTVLSIALTALALFGFGISTSYWMLCLWAVPYGLGAGSIDAALNNYVALHFKSRHMSWLHCMWGIGASTGPYIMNMILTQGGTWHQGYQTISLIQLILTAVVMLSLPLWKKQRLVSDANTTNSNSPSHALSLREIFALRGAKEVMITFFAYCALEQTAGLWASSYLSNFRGIDPVTAAGYASLFYLGITGGRAINGFITFLLNDSQMIRLGQGIAALGLLLLLFAPIDALSLAGLVIIGLGCAPIYPSIIHSTPAHFGTDKSQAVIGVQMASAYLGNVFMPPLFGLIARYTSIALYPVYLILLLILMIIMHERLCKRTA